MVSENGALRRFLVPISHGKGGFGPVGGMGQNYPAGCYPAPLLEKKGNNNGRIIAPVSLTLTLLTNYSFAAGMLTASL